MFQSLGYKTSVRVLLLALSLGAFFLLISFTTFYFTASAIALIAVLQVMALIHFLNQMRYDVERFVIAVKNKDHSAVFSSRFGSKQQNPLHTGFNEVIAHQRKMELEKESMQQLFQTILEKVKFGLVVVNAEALEPTAEEKHEILFMNDAAAQIIQVPKYKYWHRFAAHTPLLSDAVQHLREGGKQFIDMPLNGQLVQLSLEVLPIRLYQTAYLIVSFQNIKDEVEQKEIEAWNKLIHVMSHEILNSITPISSLSDTARQILDNSSSLHDPESVEDLKMAVRTIKSRSDGLMDFVRDYRLVAELPSPQLQPVKAEVLLAELHTLFGPQLSQKNIAFDIENTFQREVLHIDKKLIEQALINLVTNAAHAVSDKADPRIRIHTQKTTETFIISVSDNGRGIPPENLDHIFIPFFTTRENGSGIGLTITKNILKIHQGKIDVKSDPGGETTFSLVFNYAV